MNDHNFMPRPPCASSQSPVNDSLSIIVPLRNAQAIVAEQLGRLLELLPDLTARFEIIVIDDGSNDHTVELVRDLARQYPQVRMIRHVEPRGLDAAVKTGLAWAQGQTVFVQEDPLAVSPTDLVRLWSLRHDREVVLARAQSRPGLFDAGLLERLTTWGQALRKIARGKSAGGIHMIRRQAIESIAADSIDDGKLAVHALDDRHQVRSDADHPPQPHRRPAPTILAHLRDVATGR